MTTALDAHGAPRAARAPAGRILVTGASGFVGAAVARALAELGGELRLLVRPESPRRAGLAELEAEIALGDLTDAASLERAVRGCSTVFHVAADYRIWVPDPARLEAVNVAGTRALALAASAAGVERFVYTSSVATLGLPRAGGRGDETTPVALADMVGAYKRSKFRAERALEEVARETGLDAVVVHPSTPVGPGDVRPTPTGRLIADAARGRMPAYVDTGLNVVHVDDVARGHVLAWERAPRGAHYVLGGEDMTLAEILAALAELTGRRAPRLRLRPAWLYPAACASEAWARLSGAEPRLVRDALRMAQKHMYFSSQKAQDELGYRARPARLALEDAVRWLAATGRLGPQGRAPSADPSARAGGP